MNTGEALSEGHLLDGRYRVKRVIGVGGMGRVYLANDTRLANRPVAAKEMIIGDGIAEKKAIEDFAREASVLSRLSHPGIPIVIDHFVEQGRNYLVMEFVSGGDLEGLLEQAGTGGRLSERQVIGWARQLLEVLDFLHAQAPPIIYRDLKPGNIMIDKDGRAMLIDFGIARFLPKGGRATQIGSPGYAPPEQYAGRVDARSDIYSLAATMHHVLTGRDPRLEAPFSFPPVHELAPLICDKTAQAVDRALNHDSAKRFQSAAEMLRALPFPDEVSDQTGGQSRPSPVAPSASRTKTPVTLRSAPAKPARPARIANNPPARGPASSEAPTVVLKERTSVTMPSPVAAKSAQSIKKAIELGGKAVTLIERGIKSASSMLPSQSKEAAVSSTAKTQELQPRIVTPLGPQGSTGNASKAPTVEPGVNGSVESSGLFANGAGLAPIGLPAKLIARAENIEFAVRLARTVIGRSDNPEDALDIDLAPLKRAAERVSRRHAEVVRRGDDFYIRDLGSLNGTYVAGRGRLGRDQLYKLKDRDQVVLGGAILQFRRG
ncbi:MAG TPA: protein kinase [Candidatus Binataceae bacterium]|nr:protein kinase [Candidatus Binataceae bacterium]